ETQQAFGPARENIGEHFECNLAAETQIFRAINVSHSAGAEWGNDLVGAKLRSGSQWRWAPRAIAISGRFWGSEKVIVQQMFVSSQKRADLVAELDIIAASG